ncbi:DUF2169 family type VI secretion system accessory protein [Herbaspirillum robiniae]|uniref:DUF2169 domain-containing protein n=1 Tax=Herbaspirillum robiniae TaxID=2014887 RepID=A0ABX2LVT2_9BURK|nr:DUF2169 domain-containing protein [Herbaspirillum robiniae]NUU02190.1 DUF2169 domain-containing protein [Herbaspirillum robiniae]
MKIFKPDNLALLYRNFRLGQDKLLSLGMMALFPLGRSGIAELLGEAQLWQSAAQAVGADAMLDGGMPKPAGEFFVYGAAHAREGAQVRQIEVVASVAGVRKPLYVFGDRQFGLMNASEPQPFSRMPLTRAQAFGGEGFAANPLGKGFADVKAADGQSVRPLPNVESPGQLMVSRGDTPAPAGYWALPVDAAQRTRLLGKFDERWLQKTWPYLPEDTHAEYFHEAPADQRIKGFFLGDDAFELVNLHPQQQRIAGRLPALRARCFVNQRQGANEKFTELETRAETVWLFPELECGIVLYRATARVADDDADDVLHVMAEWEELASAPLSFEHYHQLFRSQLPGAAEAAAMAAESAAPLEPAAAQAPVVAVPAAAGALAAAAVAAPDPQMTEIQRMVSELEQHTRDLMAQHGLTDKDLEKYVNPAPEPETTLSMEQLDHEVAKVEAEARKMMEQHGLTDKDLAQYLAPPKDDAPASLAEMKAMMLDLEQQTGKMMADAGLSREQVLELMASKPEMAHLVADMKAPAPDIGGIFAQLEAAEAAAVAAAATAATKAVAAVPAPALPEPEPVRKFTREQVVEHHAAGKSLAGQDLSGLDLSGLNLGGADFAGAMLEGTQFKGSALAGAMFQQALMAGADFSETDLSGARLAMASAAGASFVKARLGNADLSGADFTGGNFEAVQLAGATLTGGIFDQAKMAGLQAAGCQAEQASFAEAELGGADFSRAGLGRARFNGAALAQARFDGARCRQTEFYGVKAAQSSFAGADLGASRADASSLFDGASFVQAGMQRANWDGVSMRQANLDQAILDDADFSRVQAGGARFLRASAKATRFDKADLTGADLSTINLFKGSMRSAKVHDARLQMANLHGVDFHETVPARAALEGSNIDRTVLALRGMKT